MINLDDFRGYSIETLMNQLLDVKKHNFCNLYIIKKISYLIFKLVCENEDVIKLIESNDQEVFCLGVQMLFKDYLNQYNELCENPKWESIIFDTVKNYKKFIYGN